MSTANRSVNVQRILIVLVVASLYCTGSWATTITVSNTADSGAGSLRAALASAANGDTIDASSIIGSITLTDGELLVTNSVSIIGPGARLLAVNGNASSRVFHIGQSNLVSISNLTITNGLVASGTGGGILNDHATLIVSNCVISGNSAYVGGGIDNNGYALGGRATLKISSSTISGNSATWGGGGISNSGSGTTSSSAIAQINNCTITGNSAYVGSAVLNWGISGNAMLTVANTTLCGNSGSAIGGCIFSGGSGGSATVEIGNSILKTGPLGQNLTIDSTTLTSHGYNISSDNGGGYLTATGDQINTDPKLGPLQDNGGATKTHALLPGSAAIDAGDPAFTSPPDFDQRGSGFPRVVNGRVDIGAFEFTPDLLVTALDRIGDDVRLTFGVALFGKNYEVQSRTNLSFGSWEFLAGNVPGNGSTAQITVNNVFLLPQ